MTRPIDTIRLSHADTMLGLQVAQQTSLAKKNAANAVNPANRSEISAQVESSTQKPKSLIDDPHLRQSIVRNQNPATLAKNAALAKAASHAAYQNNLPERSTQSELTHAGKLLRSVLTQYPHGAGPLVGERPLFVSAVMLLRATALARSNILSQDAATSTNQSASKPSATQSVANSPTASSISTSSALSSALMQTLQNTVVQSGLFYEAQMVRAILGNRPEELEALRNQPQSRAHPAEQASQEKNHQKTPELSDAQEDFRATVRRQIEVLNSQTIQWQGAPWPQAEMTWLLHPAYIPSDNPWYTPLSEHDESSDRQTTDAEDSQPWCSTITLNMAALGEVKVHLWIHEISAKIKIESAQHHQTLDKQVNVLIQRLTQAGIENIDVEVVEQLPQDNPNPHELKPGS